jgi:hypothetical protein
LTCNIEKAAHAKDPDAKRATVSASNLEYLALTTVSAWDVRIATVRLKIKSQKVRIYPLRK